MAELVDALVSNTNDSNVVPVRSRLRVLWNGIRFSTENFPTAYCDKVSCGILYLFLTGPCDGNNSRTPQKQLNYIKHNYPTHKGKVFDYKPFAPDKFVQMHLGQFVRGDNGHIGILYHNIRLSFVLFNVVTGI